ncbi:MAG: type IV toxin-antitoxin system AbiEi family antitoxin domain-containing protein [Elusimicrobiota bacterium]
MPNKINKLEEYFKKNNGILKFSDITNAGFHPDTLTSLEEKGQIEKVAYGIYSLIDYIPDEYPDLVIASLQAPRGVVCLISALSFHNATTEIPGKVEMAIERGTRKYKIEYPPVKFYYFSKKTWEAGIEKHQIEGKKIKVYNLAKTIADCFKFRNKIGADIAREALKIAVREKNISPKEIMKYSKRCRVSTIVKPILETLI